MFKIEIPLDNSKDNLMLPTPYTNLSQITKIFHTEAVEAVFMYGRCHIYALTLKQLNPQLQLKAIYRDNNLHHVYCLNPETGETMDASGTYKSIDSYVDADPLQRYLLVTHKDITVEEINKLIEYNVLVPASQESVFLAQRTAESLNQIF